MSLINASLTALLVFLLLLVLIHGDRDATVPFSSGVKIHALAAPPKDFWKVTGGRHMEALIHREDSRQRLVAQLISWCE